MKNKYYAIGLLLGSWLNHPVMAGQDDALGIRYNAFLKVQAEQGLLSMSALRERVVKSQDKTVRKDKATSVITWARIQKLYKDSAGIVVAEIVDDNDRNLRATAHLYPDQIIDENAYGVKVISAEQMAAKLDYLSRVIVNCYLGNGNAVNVSLDSCLLWPYSLYQKIYLKSIAHEAVVPLNP